MYSYNYFYFRRVSRINKFLDFFQSFLNNKILKMTFRLIVSVEENIKTIIGPKIPKIDNCITFGDLYSKVIPSTYRHRDIEIYGRIDAKSKWILIEECFDDELEVIISLKFTEIKFKIISSSPI